VLEEAPVPGEVAQGTPVVPKAVKSKKVKNGKAGHEQVGNKAPIIEPTQGEQGGLINRLRLTRILRFLIQTLCMRLSAF